ncbi:dTDP-4-dehydrorhamnose reductase [Sphingomonas guangdongensis]|uniref:dTDP-4-dehydrorhamnose reductase n=1 Tax=Sphingomonas guangdongensis TaxID=1141890 RepID=A0A285QI14_9SPHN|nr:dTDP-4-dehydrorhamnose reductase [Sphingomonas guangdongensis]SOB81124.1 dTDP-4-dehydrorhamnose reductase [Sphingomonas guangdongensis]
MKALVTGANGQLGTALQRAVPADAHVVAVDMDVLDITDQAAVDAFVRDVAPNVIFNAAAYTAVDRAEQDEALALAVNATAVGYLSQAAAAGGARLVHVSTDFVFEGLLGVPYTPEERPTPLSVYGRTKREGEWQAGGNALILRTAWVYAPTGGNFVRTMLRVMAERDEVRVVADQIGTPTYAPGLADAMWQLAAQDHNGIYHYTDSGVASWYDFAIAIQEEALALGLLNRAVPVVPIRTADYPTPAKRPHYSVLDKSKTIAALGYAPPHWRSNLRVMLSEIKANG